MSLFNEYGNFIDYDIDCEIDRSAREMVTKLLEKFNPEKADSVLFEHHLLKCVGLELSAYRLRNSKKWRTQT